MPEGAAGITARMKRSPLFIGVTAGAGLVTALLLATTWRTTTDPEAPGTEPAANQGTAAKSSLLQEPSALPDAMGRSPEDPFPQPPPDMDTSLLAELFPADDPAWGWAQVDLDALRDELPGNLAFDLAVPTDNPRTLAERAATRERWREEYGRILGNTADESEIRDYYAERQKVSADYVEFTDVVLERYGDVLSEQDRGLLQLAQTLHRARLEEMPARLTDALDRNAEHADQRAAWLADEAAFLDTSSGSVAEEEPSARSN